MTQGQRVGFSVTQKGDIWSRWKVGQSFHEIGRAFAKAHSSIRFLVSHHCGIASATGSCSLYAMNS